ncbi:alpha-N-arabinofuranosidase [Aeoliella mucimassa]|uniref:non-reducing end alpha-L-arabinofuranosidase n=1 Tax=Aeoliella mucimassa TaxID=2527972 RepID=A0A518AWP3_9BACT|nr:alpha-L-arabinofuranosidase C-terminal domain-containing protein [Aeoliella mucimassa]QDU59155.1 Intracellular exo-alpha-(1->5)-L-arabinofuranosidase 1 [Aeoliella mucimassa]
MYTVTVNPHRKIGCIDQKIYGHFTEHAFQNIYQGMYAPDHPLADVTGLRKDVVDALKEVRVPVLRYPGGNFVSNYHWEDGIGSQNGRKRRFDYAWETVEDNQFGTNEFMQLCRATGAEPYLCCNMGTGTIRDAMNWVEYCNSNRDTYYASLRRENGFEEPFGVKYWGLGNECYAPWQMGGMNASDYAKHAMEFGKAIRFADPNAYLVACGFESDPAWNIEVLGVLKDMVNSISIHHYSIDWGCFNLHDYHQLMSISEFVNEMIKSLRAAIEGVTGDIYHPMKIALDEWNMFGWVNERVDDNSFYTLENAMVTASVLNTLIRNCNVVEMANYSVFVNINGTIQADCRGIVLRPQYYVFKLYTHHMGNVLVDSDVISEQFETNMPIDRRVFADYFNEAAVEKGGRLRSGVEKSARRSIKYLDSVSTIDETRDELSVALINKHPEKNVECTVDIIGSREVKNAQVHSIWSAKLNDCNTAEKQSVILETSEPICRNGKFTLELPRHSISVLKLTY